MRDEVREALQSPGVFREPSVPLADWQLELRLKVLKQIENDPESLDMTDWWNGIEDDEQRAPDCKTTRCIAGWARYFAGVPLRFRAGVTYESGGITVLGLTHHEFFDGQHPMLDHRGLFYMSDEDAVERLRQICDAPE